MLQIVKMILLAVVGLSAGTLVAGGVFTTLIALGLVPRFAGRTHTANRVLLYENGIIGGCWFAMILSIWPVSERILVRITENIPVLTEVAMGGGGFFAGCFVGCMALAIAEMLDGISIFARRLSFRKGIGLAVLGVAIGKLLGSLYYFITGISVE